MSADLETAAENVPCYRVEPAVLRQRAERSMSTIPRPFLRWAGSKQRLLPHLVNALPPAFNRYYEPFLGSASLFFLLQPGKAFLSDACSPLIEVYEALRSDVESVIRALMPLNPLDKAQYYEVRGSRSEDLHTRAAEFLYLNRACWNGLYRVNGAGVFNVPYGAPKSAGMPEPENLRACSRLLRVRSIKLLVRDFQVAVASAGRGDLVFFDPPYVTGHNNNGFIDYNEQLFSWEDQVRLAGTAQRLSAKGAHVLITNAHHDSVLALYPGFEVRAIERKSTLANNTAFRRPVTEALFCSPATKGPA